MNNHLHSLVRQIFDNTDTPCKPSPAAMRRGLHLLYVASRFCAVPRGTVCCDVTGSLYIIWRNGWRKLHLTIPANPDIGTLATQTAHEPHLITSNTFISDGYQLSELLKWYAERCVSEADKPRTETLADFIDDTGLLELLVLDCI